MSLTLPKTCSMGGSKTGLVGTIGVTLLDPDGTTHTARATAGIYEIGGGCYGKEITFEDNWKGVLLWDTGGGSPVYASEEYHMGAIWDEVLTGATHNVATSAGRRLREVAAYAIHSGTAQAGTATTITLAAGADGGDGIFNRNLIVIVGGTGIGQTRTIADYNDTTKVCVIDREWRINPNATSEYQIVADDTPLVVDHGLAQAGSSTTITLRDYASSVDNVYLCNIIAIIGGTGRGQARLVGSYDGSTKVVTICGDDWVTAPDNTSVYAMVPYGTTCTSCVGASALAQIADAAWDELQSGHVVAGTFGKYLDQEISTIAAAIGSGLLSCTWTQKDVSGNPMDNVQIWITTDESGSNVVAGALYTNTAGEVTFMLDAGSYYIWREKGGYNFTPNPQSWTVS